MRLAATVALLVLLVGSAVFEQGSASATSPDEQEAIHEAIREQLPTELPPEEDAGWPQHAFTMAITWYRIGEEDLARQMADELWGRRDPDSGLWRNGVSYVDVVNPFFATVLYELVGQGDRARATSENAIRHARKLTSGGAYNEIWLAALSAPVIGEPPPSDLLTASYEGITGSYSMYEHGTARGRYYADIMRAYWCATGGKCMESLGDETDYCVDLARGRRECETFYSWSRGESSLPELGDEGFSFWTDGVLFYAMSGLDLEVGSFPMPFRAVVPGMTSNGQ